MLRSLAPARQDKHPGHSPRATGGRASAAVVTAGRGSPQVAALASLQRKADENQQIRALNSMQRSADRHSRRAGIGWLASAGAPGNIAQFKPEETKPHMPEHRQISEMHMKVMRQIRERDPYYPSEALIEYFRSILPAMDRKRIRQALEKYSTPEQAWESLFIDPAIASTDKSIHLHSAQIGGHEGTWSLRCKLGSGTEANVFRGREKQDPFAAQKPSKDVAIKIFKGKGPAFEQAFEEEVDAHQKIKEMEANGHVIPNIVRMLDYNNLLRMVVMDLAPGRALSDDDKKSAEILTAFEKARDETLGALRKQGYELGDLQPRNTMWDEETKTITFVDITLRKLE